MDLNDIDETVVGPGGRHLQGPRASLVLAGLEGEPRHRPGAGCASRCQRRTGPGSVAFQSYLPRVSDGPGGGDHVEAGTSPTRRVLDRRRQGTRNDSARVVARWVGPGSVGLRSYLVLLRGNEAEALVLVLQVEQASRSALTPYVHEPARGHEGEWIVHVARLVQADTVRGWTTTDEHQFIVRQLRRRKGAMIDPSALRGKHLDDDSRLAGGLLARAHTRWVDPRVLDGCCRDHDEFDRAISAHALANAERTRLDLEALATALNDGLLETPPRAPG